MKDKNKMHVTNSGWNYLAIILEWLSIVFTITAIVIGIFYFVQRSWVGGWQYASDQQSISNKLNAISPIVIAYHHHFIELDVRLKVLEQDNRLGMSLSNLFITTFVSTNVVTCSTNGL